MYVILSRRRNFERSLIMLVLPLTEDNFATGKGNLLIKEPTWNIFKLPLEHAKSLRGTLKIYACHFRPIFPTWFKNEDSVHAKD